MLSEILKNKSVREKIRYSTAEILVLMRWNLTFGEKKSKKKALNKNHKQSENRSKTFKIYHFVLKMS